MVARCYSLAVVLLALAIACNADFEGSDLVDELQSWPTAEDATVVVDLGTGTRQSAANSTEVRRDRVTTSECVLLPLMIQLSFKFHSASVPFPSRLHSVLIQCVCSAL